MENVPEGFAGPFTDDDGLTAEPIFDRLVASGAFVACDEWGTAACPALAASNLDAATWIGTLGRTLVPVDSPTDPAAIIAGIIENQLACGADICPAPPLTRGDVVAMLHWAVQQEAYEEAASSSPDATIAPPTPYWATDPVWAEAQLRQLGLTDDCSMINLPLDSLLSRAQLAEMVGQAFGLLPVLDCGNMT